MAMKRGTMRKAMGSMASTRSASICSVTTIVPSSAVLLAPTRPEIISAVSSGATSRSVPKPAAPAEQPLGAVALHQRRGLDDHDGAGEERRDDDDGQRLDRHLVEVALQLRAVEARREGEERATGCARRARPCRPPSRRCRGTRRRSPRRRSSSRPAVAAPVAAGSGDIGARRYYSPSQSIAAAAAELGADVGAHEGQRRARGPRARPPRAWPAASRDEPDEQGRARRTGCRTARSRRRPRRA